MENTWLVAAAWMGLALLANIVSIRVGFAIALAEILAGVIAGNSLGLRPTPWIDFLATVGSGLLTFLAGAEIDPGTLRAHWRASLSIGLVSFLAPFAGALVFAHWVAGWSLPAAKIAGIALSTTSVAVVYSVMVESRLTITDLGKLTLAACFVTDLGTVLALGILFARFDAWLLLFVAISAVALWFLPSWTRWIMATMGNRVSEAEMKFLFLVLFGLGGLAMRAGSKAVLPAYLAGLAAAGVFLHDRAVLHRMRSLAFAVLTPFYFIKAGLFVSLPVVWQGAGLIGLLLLVKLAAKAAGVWPLTRAFGMGSREGNYVTLLMATGLTFGTISALFGLSNGIITQAQYTVLVTVVILSAVVPTLVAQAFFRPVARAVAPPTAVPVQEAGVLAAEAGDSRGG